MKNFKLRQLAGIGGLIAALAVVGTPALAQTTKAKQAWARFQAANGNEWIAEWAQSSDRVASLRGLSPPSNEQPAKIASEFLRANADLIGTAGLDLKLLSSRTSPAGSHFTYGQVHGSLPVFNASVDVHVNTHGQVFLLHSGYSPPTATMSALPQVSASAAKELAAARASQSVAVLTDKHGAPITLPGLRPVGTPELGIQATPRGNRLAYRVDLGPVLSIVDANTGEILEAVPRMLSVTGHAKIFDPNPVNSLNDSTLTDQNNTDYAALATAYKTRAMTGIQKQAGKFRLIGPYVTALDLKASSVASCMNGQTEVRLPPPIRNDAEFIYNRSQSGFEHTMAFFHIARSQGYIQSIGFNNLWNASIRVDAHAITVDNSFYCGTPVGAGYLAFGDGGVDDAEEADVILHEYGHALQDAASAGKYLGNGQTGAMGEGFGDYWAFSNKPTGKWAPCFAEWDTQGGCLRRLDKNKKYPGNYVGEVHADGEIWSRGLRDLLLKVGKDTADKIILQSHFLVPASPTFAQGVKAMLDADVALFAGAHENDICSVFIDRGIAAPGCGYWINIVWNLLGADVDLHLRPPSGAGDNSYNYSGDVAYYNLHPNWGDPNSSEDDPLLYRDCITTCTSEQITIDKFTDPGTYRVMVHYYSDHGLGPANVTLQVYSGKKKLFQGGQTLTNSNGGPTGGQVWFAYNIVIAPGKAPEIVAVNRLVPAISSGFVAPAK